MIMNSILLKRILLKISKIVNLPFSTFRAMLWLKDIVSHKYKNDMYIVLLPGLGDTIFALSFYSALKKSNKTGNIVIVSDDKNVGFVSKYGINRIIPYGSSRKAILDFNENYLVSKIARKYTVINTNPYLYYKGKKESCALTLLKESVYQLKNLDTQPDFPLTLRDKNNKACEEKYMIINPYSASLSQKRWHLFNKVVDFLKRANFRVFTNVVGKQKPIDGSEELRCNIYEFFSIASNAAGIISLRSGILDLAIHSNVPMFVLYENCTEKFENIYKLEQWKTDSNIVEVNVDGICDEQIFSKIKNWIDAL